MDAIRRRTVTWDAPTPPDPARSGLATLQAVLAGRRSGPAAGALIGQRLVSADADGVAFALVPAEYHLNPFSVHGGIVTTLLDSAMTCAALATLPPGRTCTTLELAVAFHRPITLGTGPVTATARVLHAGRQVIAAEGRVTDSAGRLMASGTTTCLALELPAASPAELAAGSHTVEWADAAALDAAMRLGPALDYLRAMEAGRLPTVPAASLAGLDGMTVAPGRIGLRLPLGGHLANPQGSVHGGMIATLLDTVAGCAANSLLPAGQGMVTANLAVRFHRAVMPKGGALHGVGQVLHPGRRLSTATAEARDDAGRLCATATAAMAAVGTPGGS